MTAAGAEAFDSSARPCPGVLLPHGPEQSGAAGCGESLSQLRRRIQAERAAEAGTDPRSYWEREHDAAVNKLDHLRHLREHVFKDPEYAREVAEHALYLAGWSTPGDAPDVAVTPVAASYYDRLIGEWQRRAAAARLRVQAQWAVGPARPALAVVADQGRPRARERRPRPGGTRGSPGSSGPRRKDRDPEPPVAAGRP